MTAPVLPTTRGTLMLREAEQAPDAVAAMLGGTRAAIARIAARLRDRPPAVAITCARGSSDHAATFGKYLIETLVGVPTASAGLSVASLYEAPLRTQGALCLAISQSGRSPDLLAAVESYKRAGAFVVAVLNDPDAPLAGLADECLLLHAAPERAVAATKSFISTLAALAALTAAWSGNDALSAGVAELPAALAAATRLHWDAAVPALVEARNLFVIGRGYGLAVAQEAALKLKETCGLHAEAFSAAEVRHGPMAIVNRGFPVLAFAGSDRSGDDVREAARTFASRGAVVAIADPAGAPDSLAAIPCHPALEPVTQVQSFYRFASTLALARGLDPDAPPHLAKVTRTL